MIVLDNLPFPITSNNQYISFFRAGKVIRKPSTDYVIYKNDFRQWVLANGAHVRQAREKMKAWVSEGKVFELEMYLICSYEKLYTLEKKPRRWDVANYQKAIIDLASDALGIDDCLFWSVKAVKTEGRRPGAVLTIMPHAPTKAPIS